MNIRYARLISVVLISHISRGVPFAQVLDKPGIDDNSKYTNVGNIAVTMTNYGVFGNGFRLWPQQPSMQYPRGSGIEHCFVGGLWFGAVTPAGAQRVTTGAVDVPSLRSVAKGFEFTTGVDSRIIERSTLPDSRFYSPSDAVSHQDFVVDFTDVNTTNPNENNEPIPEHTPLGLNVHLETYAFNFAFADNFVIFNYWIKNVSGARLDSVYVALWADLVVRNTNITPPTVGSPFYSAGGLGYIDSLHLGYAYDYNGDAGLADSYAAMQFLGSTPYLSKTSYQAWQFSNTTDPTYFSPVDDPAKYSKMAVGLTAAQIAGISKPSNFMTLVTVGPISHVAAGDSVNVVFALMAAKKKSPTPTTDDSPVQRQNLVQTAGWAQRTYNGEDRNGNGIEDPDEHWTDHGKPKRYFLPSPPSPPRVKVIPKNKLVEIYWDNSSEASIDPITNRMDFEGYRIYGTNAGADLTVSQNLLASLNLLGEFDEPGDKIGYNTGFSAVRLPTPQTFPPETTKYYYRFNVPGVLNGWQYGFAVTAFDSGDASTQLQSLESSKIQTLTRVVPGTLADQTGSLPIGVYPNPYYAHAYWDGTGQRDRKLYFYNLPPRAEITIYTLAGDLVDRFQHDASTYNASDISWFQHFSDGSQLLAGGEHAWDMISQHDQAVATGLYVYTVRNKDSGDIKRGKFLVIK